LLLDKGIKPYYEDNTDNIDNIFTGKKVVITGTFKINRKKIINFIKKSGGKVTGSVSSKTDFILAGENTGSKLQDGKDLGVEIIEEEKFNKYFEQQ